MHTEKVIGTGVLKSGRVMWDDAPGFTRDLRALGDGSVVVTAKLASAAAVRSEKACRYYFGVVLAEAEKYTGQSKEDIHDAMCARFLPSEQKQVEFFNKLTGESLTIDVDHRRSSKLKGGPFYDFVENVRQFLREFLGVETADPDPEYWRKRASKVAA